MHNCTSPHPQRSDMIRALVHASQVIKQLLWTAYVHLGLALEYRRAAEAYISGFAKGYSQAEPEAQAKQIAETTGEDYDQIYRRVHAEIHGAAYLRGFAQAAQQVKDDPDLIKRVLLEETASPKIETAEGFTQ